MITPSAFKYWHETYAKAAEIPELGESILNSCSIAEKGSFTDSAEVADLLMQFPFTGVF